MFKVEFEWREDQEYGIQGWIPAHIPGFNAGSGRVIAHDTLEHARGDRGTMTEELIALGAALYVRAEGGYFHYRDNPHGGDGSILGRDMSNFMRMMHDGNYGLSFNSLKPAPMTTRLNDWPNEILEAGLVKARSLFIEEIIDYGDADDAGCEGINLTDLNRMLASMRGWLRIGYRRAKVRYHQNEVYDLAHFFRELEEHIDKCHKHGDFGEMMTVRVCPKKLEFKVTRDFAYDY